MRVVSGIGMVVLGLSALAISLLMSGCGSGGSGESGGGGFSQRGREGGGGNVLRYPINTNPTTFDPAVVQDGDTIDLLQNVYESLVTWDEKNEIVPAVAEKWEVQEGGKVYVFTIRKGMKFHNGREVTAEDVKWSIERAATPALKSPTTEAYLSDIVGLSERVAGKAESIKGIEVVDPSTVKITLKQPTPYFLGKLTYLVAAPLPKESVPAEAEITQVSEMVGTGPFKVEGTVRDQETTLVRFDEYWGGPAKLEKIIRPVIKDNTTVLAKYENGEIEIARLQRQDIEGVKANTKLAPDLKFFDRAAIWYVGMNQLAYPPFKDRRVRRAFAMAIDRDRIVQEIMGGSNKVAYSILPPGLPGHRDKANVPAYNPEEAKKLLAEAGFPDGKGLPALEMNFREQFRDIQLVAEAAAGDLKKNLGVEVNLRQMEWRAYLEKFNKKEIPFYHMRWSADFLDPQNFLSHMLATNGPENKMGYSNAEFDKLCAQADVLLDMEKRIPLYQRAEDIALQDAVWVPIYFQNDAELISPKVKGLRKSLFGHLPHTTTTIE